MLNASESAQFFCGFPKTLKLPNFKLILVFKLSFWDTFIKCKRILKCILKGSVVIGFLCGPRGQDLFLPVILRNLLAPGIDPSEMFDELDVGDLSSASEHQVLPRLDLLAARWQDSQMRLRRSSVVTPAACEETSFRPGNHNWVAITKRKTKCLSS